MNIDIKKDTTANIAITLIAAPFRIRGQGTGRGFGRFMGGFKGGMGANGPGFRTGRKLGGDELQLLLLALLEEKPSHGYELIKLLGERSGGFYSPSPGMVYPALTYLEEIGYASVAAEGAKKALQPDARRQRLSRRASRRSQGHPEPVGNHRPAHGRRPPRLFGRGRRRGVTRRRPASHPRLAACLARKAALVAGRAKRVVEILRRATEEILGKPQQ